MTEPRNANAPMAGGAAADMGSADSTYTPDYTMPTQALASACRVPAVRL